MTIEAIDITSLDAFEHDVDEAVSQSAPLEPSGKVLHNLMRPIDMILPSQSDNPGIARAAYSDISEALQKPFLICSIDGGEAHQTWRVHEYYYDRIRSQMVISIKPTAGQNP